MASNNMYRVGDFVYFESSATAPYQIRRIDELNKTPTGAVEAKVACYFRRRDVSIALINQAEKYYVNDYDGSDEDCGPPDSAPNGVGDGGPTKRSRTAITELDKHRIKHRELFLSRQIECLPATHIRGKCSVTLYNDAEPLTNYLAREDTFYYKLIYDPALKTLQEDRGAMRIGSDHQSEIQSLLKGSETDPRFSSKLEELVWKPGRLTNQEIDMFCLLVRAVGTLGRAYDTSSSCRQPLLLSAASASGRDITRQHAHDLLHKADYDVKKAIELLLPSGQPVVCKDQLEEWSTSESHLFEEALDKYSKVFPDILSDYMPWKTHKSLVEMYYFWKTTDRYVRQRRTKLAAQEHKLKQVYIPNYSKPNPSVLYNGPEKGGRGCEGCPATTSPQWYAWGPQNLLYRLCTSCWTYWKRYGGLRNLVSKGSGSNSSSGRPCPEQRAQERQAASRTSSQTSGSTSETDSKPMVIADGPVGSTASTSIPSQSAMRYAEGSGVPAALVSGPRGTLCFRTPSIIRLARVLCPELVRPVLLARRPGKPAETTATGGSSSISGSGDAVADSLSFAALRTTVEPLLSRLPDPTVLLVRPRRIAPLDCVINNLAERKGIPLQRIDFSHALGSASQLNGPILAAGKRLRSPSGGNELNGTGASSTKREMGDLLNGTQPVQEDNTSTSPPPCKKQATTGATGGTRTDPSNGIIIVPDGPVEKEENCC
ncbi:hypothetical protein CRM22_010703 [Opisthorchis felineus]|uniref:BAH domain-containing protein n=1 Tax=Opisthorchis felineus TaxID=147828 RepID=A0A4V3SB96_OPIFE|nr:hypothetical protein CRM22_010703 [Opisthorchis felineus]